MMDINYTKSMINSDPSQEEMTTSFPETTIYSPPTDPNHANYTRIRGDNNPTSISASIPTEKSSINTSNMPKNELLPAQLYPKSTSESERGDESANVSKTTSSFNPTNDNILSTPNNKLLSDPNPPPSIRESEESSTQKKVEANTIRAASSVASTNDLDSHNEQENSGFVFPNYEDFLKSLDEEENKETDKGSAGAANSELDEIFSVFEREMENLSKKNSNSKIDSNDPRENGDYHCIRLTSQLFANPYQILQVTPETPDEEVKQKFRRISLMIHPDKCKHPSARQAFQILSKANEQLQKPEMRKRYSKVIEDAKKLVMKERIKENQALRSMGKELLSEDLSELQSEIMEKCEKILAQQEERRSYAEKTKAANERYEKEQEAKQVEEALKKRQDKRKWEDSRQERVNSWRNFKGLVEEKKIKLNNFTGVRHYKEQRVGPAPKVPPKPAHKPYTKY